MANEEQSKRARIWLDGAKFVEVIGGDPTFKTLTILLKNEALDELGIFLMDKTPFATEEADVGRILDAAKFECIAHNDIFGNYHVLLPADLNLIKGNLIYPANEKVIAKYRKDETVLVYETAENYKNVVLPHIEQNQLNLQWVYNVLEKKAEADTLLFEDTDEQTGFGIWPDLKWDGKQLENFYVLAIIRRHGVKSIRDLTDADIPMLKKIQAAGREVAGKKGIPANKLKMYFHYQPSFYHLHVHIVHSNYLAPGGSLLHAVPLDDVIERLRWVPDFYQKATISFMAKIGAPITKLLQAAAVADEGKE